MPILRSDTLKALADELAGIPVPPHDLETIRTGLERGLALLEGLDEFDLLPLEPALTYRIPLPTEPPHGR